MKIKSGNPAILFGVFIACAVMSVYKLAKMFNISIRAVLKFTVILISMSIGVYLSIFASYMQSAWILLVIAVLSYLISTTNTEKFKRFKI